MNTLQFIFRLPIRTTVWVIVWFLVLSVIGLSCKERLDYIGGEIIMLKKFHSKYVPPRNIEIYVPPGYDGRQKCKVIYMHDGQNVFNPLTSYTGIDWGVDEALDTLINNGVVPPVIVVAIWNIRHRIPEYMPQKASVMIHDSISQMLKQYIDTVIYSDSYLKFIVHELKPYIDSNYNTYTTPEHTIIMGSSMGGLISAYAVCEYPEVFGKAGCLSTHWLAGNGIFIKYMSQKLPEPGNNIFYFDYGTLTLDAPYETYQLKANEVLRQNGYLDGIDFVSKKFENADHSEKSWKERIDIPLRFLLL